MTKQRKYIIFRADWRETYGVDERKLSHTGGLTDILAEYFDSSGKPYPEPGYRPIQFVRVEESIDPCFPDSYTHSRVGDWKVVRVEEYESKTSGADFNTIVVCYCQYDPIETSLYPIQRTPVTIESFGGDKEAYQNWLNSQKAGAAL
ncbi:MAG TPA: hypothetical protein DD379_10785 [Cyanobacteria bacterium UBA11162]|nr:hypothetical protein [Cyanobacteria bacterium UBA12227]HAX85511.1 hypothetical protein [Cyanobacteria bacterium UBA11370]HBL11873.1 hypothetical protein [Cyanobacteria bacterium UBA11162]HBY80188.1 hypothetical protein [Cyanobacteria bacterium UBA11148]